MQTLKAKGNCISTYKAEKIGQLYGSITGVFPGQRSEEIQWVQKSQ